MTKNTDRFAYEYAERFLDRYIRKFGTARLKHAWVRTKSIFYSIAFTDYCGSDELTPHAKAKAWEEMQAAFAGVADHMTSGVVLQLWSGIDDKQREKFRTAVFLAFDQAEKRTHADVPRLYLRKWRKNIVLPVSEDGWLEFAEPKLNLPMYGPALRAYLQDDFNDRSGPDIDAIMREYGLLEEIERAADAVIEEAPKPTLSLIEGGRPD